MNHDGVVIRPASLDDLDAVAAIFGHYVTTSVVTFEEIPPNVAHWRAVHAASAERSLPFLACVQASAVVGFAYATPWRTKPAYRHTVEDTIYVAPSRTGQGLGHLLLAALLSECAKVGVEQVVAVIADSGDGASTALHRAHGFTQAGRLRRVGFKHGRYLDTVLLQRDLRDDRRTTPAADPSGRG